MSGPHGSDGGQAQRAGRRDLLAVVEKAGHALAFFDLADGELVERISLGQYPHEMVVDPDGRYAYVAHYGVRMSANHGAGGSRVFVIDLERLQQVSSIELEPFRRLHGIAMDDEGRLYVLSEEQAVLLRVDSPEGAVAPSAAVPTGGIKTHMVVTDRSGTRAYVTGLLSHTVSLVDPHDAARPPIIASPGRLPESCALSTDETRLYVGSRGDQELVELDAATLEERKRVELSGDPLRVYVVPGTATLLVTDIEDKAVREYDADLVQQRSLGLHGTPAGISFHPDEPTAFVTLLDTNEVAVVDLGSLSVRRTIATGPEPDVTALVRPRRT